MLDTLKLSERTVVHARHYAALPELVTTTDLLAIVPQSYARSMASRWPVCVRALPGDAPQYDVQMVWHATAEREPAHLWLRALVRRLFARGAIRRDRGGGPGVVPPKGAGERAPRGGHLGGARRFGGRSGGPETPSSAKERTIAS